MRVRFVALCCISWLWLCAPTLADQRQDYMFDRSPTGNFLVLDYFGTGGQLTLQTRTGIYPPANDATAGAQALIAYPLGQANVFARLRILFLEFGGSLGYRVTWRNLSFEPGKNGEYCSRCNSESRRDRDPVLGSGPDTDRFMFAEAYAQLYAPFNEYVVFTSILAARYEGARPRSYDWFFTDIHDGGVIGRSEHMLFVKHRDWGAIGPYVQIMFLPQGPRYKTEIAYGFNAVTRLGLVQRNDLLLLTFLIQPGDDYYGQHAYYSPVRALLIYRMTLAL